MSQEPPKPDDAVPPLYLDHSDASDPNPAAYWNEDNGDRRVVSGWTVIPWIVIIMGTTTIVAFVAINMFLVERREVSKAQLLQQTFMGKYLLGAKELVNIPVEQDTLDALNTGPLEQRWCYVAMVNEFQGAEQAQTAILAIEAAAEKSDLEWTSQQTKLRDILRAVLSDYQAENWDAGSADNEERDLLKDELSWFGKLLLNPAEKTDNTERLEIVRGSQLTFVLAIVAVLTALLFGAIGLVGMVIYLVALSNGKLRSRFRPRSLHGSVYVETFAIWLVLFLGTSILIGFLPVQDLLLNGTVMLASLVVLAWPVFRGVPWYQVREDIGLTVKKPLGDVLAGISVYVSMLPVMAMCLLVVLLLMSLEQAISGTDDFSPGGGGGSHPIINEFFGPEPLMAMFKVCFLTIIVAPIVEETMFRGVLFRHLRDATDRWTLSASVLFSAFINSLIFAAIHPQGIFGIPILLPLAFGFSLVRQWRASLLGPMLMHAIHNALATVMMFLLIF